ncbi:MAG: type II secretion system protein [Bacilli bacterium]|nr:type II secretion system protein [Bacilli bacterium]
MKKLNKKGFTLIELLAVVVIMGILMLVAIPAVSKYISQSRDNTYASTLKSYGKAVSTAFAAGELGCSSSKSGTYTVGLDEVKSKLLDSGGGSPYPGNNDITGYIKIVITNGRPTYTLYASTKVRGGKYKQVRGRAFSEVTKANIEDGTSSYPNTTSASCTIDSSGDLD